MAAINSTTTTTGNDADYVSGSLADVFMLVSAARRLIENKDGEASCLLEKAMSEIRAAQDYLEAMDPIESPISHDVAKMLGRIGRPRM
ncbi:MAG: hypothetical protein KKE51_08245 [Gammaproteobacteria bacterium]|nr:hypothetical protein [Gammaproteobacteria bacterium]MBU1602383.1 hypothetical protein [Gammaproteobacteria bacterium]MBU2433188.1 hypothetical protein [Gammaproteobacteria bacterium]MBU2451104.1 hypothetical protein [Gammaproteobacteria bacterium]